MNITEASKTLFIELAKDAGNWNGNPLIDISKEQRGNLSQLKKSGLLTTFIDDRCQFVEFTNDGRSYAETLGINLYRWGHEKPASPVAP